MKEGERGPFSPKLRVRIKDNNSSPHGKFPRFLFPFSSKFPDLKPRLICSLYFNTYVTHTGSLGYLWCDWITLKRRDRGIAKRAETFLIQLTRMDPSSAKVKAFMCVKRGKLFNKAYNIAKNE